MGMGMDVDMDMDAYWLVSWTELGRGLKGASVLSVTTHVWVKDGWRLPREEARVMGVAAYWVLM